MNHELALNEIAILYVVYVAEQAGLGITRSETSKTSFLVSNPI